MSNHSEEVAIVTGASRGIGAAIAKRLAADGFSVLVNYSGSEKEAEKVVEEIKGNGGDAFSFQADVSDPGQVKRMFDRAKVGAGGLHVLVNNAGIMQLDEIGDYDDETIEKVISVNLKGPLYTMREAANRMRDGGRIINLSTSVVGLYLPKYGVYAAAKAAVEALTHILSKEMRGRGITVNAVAPGPTATELFLDGKSEDLVDQLAKMAPLERLGEPEDIANVVSFLAGPDGAWVNGQVLKANGGIV